jgi:hypothetical protein
LFGRIFRLKKPKKPDSALIGGTPGTGLPPRRPGSHAPQHDASAQGETRDAPGKNMDAWHLTEKTTMQQ